MNDKDPRHPIVIVYGRPACGMVYPTRHALEQHGVAYEYIDIQDDPAARAMVRQINGGYESVPTLVFADGSTLTEPTGREIEDRLRALGYEPDVPAWGERAE